MYDNKKFWEELTSYFPFIRYGPRKKDTHNNYSIAACVFVAAITFSPSRCLATIGDTHILKYAAEMGSGAMILMPSFIKIVQSFRSSQRGHEDTDSMVIA
jgi:hypothetical protein